MNKDSSVQAEPSCDGCKWEETKGYVGECHHCSQAYRDYYEVEE